ncbi:MAG TPA: DUF6588 family protein [Candidatus Acidoferrales bacterium]|nr:DUF6588 family protein [Candidatus Acidoferrales bacterium]
MLRSAVVLVLAGCLAASLAPPARADLSEKLGVLGGDDAKGYLSPLPKALSSTLNAGIFQTGRVPETGFGFALSLHAMGVTFGSGDRTFQTTATPQFPSVSAPTVVGSTGSVAVKGQGNLVSNFPGGLDISQFVAAAPQLSIGTVMGTRAVLRYFSDDIGNSDFGKLELFGIGAQHSISRYLRSIPADVAIGAFYQTFKLGDGLLDTKAFHVDVTASRDFGRVLKLQPYVSVGYDTFNMDVAYTSSSDPTDKISVKMDTQSNAHLAVGAQLSLAALHLSGEVFSAANSGAALGLSVGL